ncbi:MAG: hypothetical protein ABSH08_20205 [Tepidisphaeraceae bacterium]
MPMLEPLAVLFTFAAAVCEEAKADSPPAAARGDSSFPFLADGHCERQQASQRFAHRRRLVIFE